MEIKITWIALMFLACALVRGETHYDPTPRPPAPSTASLPYADLARWQWYALRGLPLSSPTLSRLFTNRFVINYNASATPPTAAQTAIAAAVNVLSSYFNVSYAININASWVDLTAVSPTLLGQGKPAVQCRHPNTAGFAYVYVPGALYTPLTGAANCPAATDATHITILLNANPPAPWYYGVDGAPPSNAIDLMTVVMHELLHGLGFLSGVTSGAAAYPSAPYGYFYDWFVFSGITGWPAAYSTPVSNPCVASSAVLTTSPLYFKGTVGGTANAQFAVYTPGVFAAGSSISHVATAGTANRLMNYALSSGAAYHDIGGNVWSAMASFGYPMKNCAARTSAGCAACIADYCQWCYQDAFCGDAEAPGFWGAPATCSASNGWLNATSQCGNGGTTLAASTAAAATTTAGCLTSNNLVNGAVSCATAGAPSLDSFVF